MIFFQIKNIHFFIGCTHFLKYTNHPTFHSEKKVGQLSKRKRLFCWSIYIIQVSRRLAAGQSAASSPTVRSTGSVRWTAVWTLA